MNVHEDHQTPELADHSEKSPSSVATEALVDPNRVSITTTLLRSVFGGTLMGLANLVPGISGGTMLLAAGIYPNFVEAVANVTRFRFTRQTLIVLGAVGSAALLSIVLLAGPLKDLVLDYRWVMYSLFIGLTLGGIPLVWRLARPATPGLVVSAIGAFAAMVGLAVLQAYDVVGSGSGSLIMYFIAGLVGASAMILPGLSGGYLLLLLGQYVPILSAIDQFKEALKARDIAAAIDPAMTVMLPVGIGVLLGIAVVGNALQWLLKHHKKPTLGVLLGLLVGSTAGLWPFQEGVAPQVGDRIKGQVVTQEMLPDIDEEDWKIRYFRPSAIQVGGSLAMILVGLGITLSVARIGAEKEQ